MIGESMLQLREGNAVDESIKSYEYDGYQPITGTHPNSAGQITITIENQDQFQHLHNSYLLIEANTCWADGGTCQLSPSVWRATHQTIHKDVD